MPLVEELVDPSSEVTVCATVTILPLSATATRSSGRVGVGPRVFLESGEDPWPVQVVELVVGVVLDQYQLTNTRATAHHPFNLANPNQAAAYLNSPTLGTLPPYCQIQPPITGAPRRDGSWRGLCGMGFNGAAGGGVDAGG